MKANQVQLLDRFSYTKYGIYCHQLNTNCKPQYSVTNTKCSPNIICHSL